MFIARVKCMEFVIKLLVSGKFSSIDRIHWLFGMVRGTWFTTVT